MDHGSANPLHRAVHDKRPIPEIDFTLHTMEDGTQVSTQERVCKGTDQMICKADRLLITSCRCASTSITSAYARPVFVPSRP